jgi:L-fucose isomerase-like protein
MNNRGKNVPRAGLVSMAFPGYYLGEEKARDKHEEMRSTLENGELYLVTIDGVVTDRIGAREAGSKLAEKGVDFILAVLTTFIPDHFIVEMLDTCDVPVFLWAVEREIGCISLVGAMLINPTLYDLGKRYQLYAGDIGDRGILEKLLIFARASMMARALREMRVGYLGENPDIMFSMAADEYGIKKVFGATVIPIRDFEFSSRAGRVPDEKAGGDWSAVKGEVGSVKVSDKEGILASKAFMSVKELAEEHRLDCFSINCWTQLKAKICLPIARLNDLGIGAGCEGDLHSTILMRLLYILGGHSAINGDFLRMFPEENEILFSHCGAGPFSIARSKKDIVLHESIETHDGVAVFYPANRPGRVTACNLMGSRAGYRLAILTGDAVETDMIYEGNPMRIRFEKPVGDILQSAVEKGAGHHWSIAYGDFSREFELLARFLGVEFSLLSV